MNKEDSPFNTNILVLGLSSMVSTFCLSLWQGYLPIYFSGMGYQKWEIGILYTLAAVAVVAAFFVSGWLGDRYGRKTMIVWSTVGLAIASSLLSFPLTAALVTGFLLYNWSTTALQPNFRAMITDSVSKGYRGRALGIFNSMAVALASVAILLSGLYVNSTDARQYAEKLPVLFTLSAVVIAIVAVSRQAGLFETFRGMSRGFKSIVTDNISPITVDKLRLLTIAYMVHDAGLSLVLFLIPIYAVEYLGMPSSVLGLMLALNYFITLVLQAPFGKLADSWGRTKVITLSFFIEAVAIGSLILVRNPLYLLLVYGIWVAVGQLDAPAEGALLADLSPQDRRGAVMGGFGGITTLAAIPAPTLGGGLVTVFPSLVDGYGLPFLVSFVVLLASAIMILYYRNKVYSG
ncbi:MAG: MFS transporter [Conexivisphaerales archaeon]